MAQYLISLPALERNARILKEVAEASGAKIVLALKAFSTWPSFEVLRPYLSGCCASGLWEAKLSQQFFGKETLTYSPAYSDSDLAELLEFTTHLDFNSLSQWARYRDRCLTHPRYLAGDLNFGLRINPLHSTGQIPLYDPCSPECRLGVTADQLDNADLSGLSTLHFHTLCEQPADDLIATMMAVERNFGFLLSNPQFTDLNLGGGHWITKPDYDRASLVNFLKKTAEKYQLQLWLEPGEAVTIHSGVLRSQVLDVFTSQGIRHVILDISATCHMPDVLEMPYRPDIFLVDSEPPKNETIPAVTIQDERYHLASENGANLHRIGGPSCLAGDTVGDYSFPRPLQIGDVLVFDDMAHYTNVKSTLFNGVPHPELALLHGDGTVQTVKKFDYSDFAARFGERPTLR